MFTNLPTYLLNYLLTYSMEQSPSWEANWFCSQSRNSPHFWNPEVHYRTHKCPPLSWANSIQSPQPPPTFWRSNLILSSHLRLGLPNGLFPSGFPTRTLFTPLPSPIRATWPVQLILLDFTTRSVSYYNTKNVYIQGTCKRGDCNMICTLYVLTCGFNTDH